MIANRSHKGISVGRSHIGGVNLVMKQGFTMGFTILGAAALLSAGGLAAMPTPAAA
jgi:hypothetical protein